MKQVKVCTCGSYNDGSGWKKSTALHRKAIERIRQGKVPDVEINDVELCTSCRERL